MERIFKRKLYDRLLEWKRVQNGKSAILIEGARRVGKSTLVEQFAKNEYESYILIDFNEASAEVKSLFKASDVYIMPSVSEPFGISPLEAMQMGVPSIISKQSGCAEILNNVIKVDYWDTNAIADAIYSIIKYPAMYKELREKGLEEVKLIVWEKAGAKVIDIYKSLVNR